MKCMRRFNNRLCSSAVLTAILVTASTPSWGAGLWLDRIGRTLTFAAPGASEPSLEANGHSMEDAAVAFKQICVPAKFDKASAGKAAEGIGWGFAYHSEVIPFKVSVDVGGWQSKDAILNIANGIFFSNLPQCNLLVTIVGATSQSEIVKAVSSAIGQNPTNAAEATKKDGSPNAKYQPEWQLADADGVVPVVLARAAGNNAVHFALIGRKVK